MWNVKCFLLKKPYSIFFQNFNNHSSARKGKNHLKVTLNTPTIKPTKASRFFADKSFQF